MDLLRLVEGNLQCVIKSIIVTGDEIFDIRLSDKDVFDLEVDTEKRTRDVLLTLSKNNSKVSCLFSQFKTLSKLSKLWSPSLKFNLLMPFLSNNKSLVKELFPALFGPVKSVIGFISNSVNSLKTLKFLIPILLTFSYLFCWCKPEVLDMQ